jgi:ElaB/YqjD/DUF883 family membrane-anchored ribosome-binding protein
MVSLFGGGRTIKNKKLKEEVEKIDKDIKKLLEEVKKVPLGRHSKTDEQYKKLIEKILKEIEEHKKSLHELYGFRPNDFPELEMLEHYLKEYYKTLEVAARSHTIVFRKEDWEEAIEGNWHRHKIKF